MRLTLSIAALQSVLVPNKFAVDGGCRGFVRVEIIRRVSIGGCEILHVVLTGLMCGNCCSVPKLPSPTPLLSFDDHARHSGWTNPLVIYHLNRRLADPTTPICSNITGALETTLALCVPADQPLDWTVSV